MSHKMTALKIFCKVTQKSSFNGRYSSRSRIISCNWNPLENHKKYFLFHLNKLNILLANQILHILWIFIKPNSDIREVWRYWPLKDGFPSILQKFYRAAILLLREQKILVDIKLLVDISFGSSLQNTVLPSLLLFLCPCY